MLTKFILVVVFIFFAQAQEQWIIGTSSNTIIPPINGKVDYVGKSKKKKN
jgi:hypothetical protein